MSYLKACATTTIASMLAGFGAMELVMPHLVPHSIEYVAVFTLGIIGITVGFVFLVITSAILLCTMET